MTFKDYPGAKGAEGVWQRIISEMPPHSVYIEAFAGSAVIARKKRPAETTILVDADQRVIDLQPGGTAICDDARGFLRRYPWKGGELVYCDPPYLLSTRSNANPVYRFEMTRADHIELLKVLRALPCMVMLSGYHSPLYSSRLADWRTVEIPTVKHNGQRAIEVVWMNFPEPVQLHDYRFLGSNYRERERIRKKTKRWQRRLSGMAAIERAALLSAIEQLAPSWLAVNAGADRQER